MFKFTAREDDLRVVVMDEDTFSDDLVGEGTINISKFRNCPQPSRGNREMR